jgi:predicted lipid-binding transport protein (Tim44 family)
MGGIPYGDIIVIGAIAVFILLRYRAMLGEKTERDDMPPSRPLAEFERVIQLPEREPAKVVPIATAAADQGAHHATFQKMRGFDRQFSADEFLEGARSAFEMVLEAFNDADRDTLKMLLSDEIYREFEASLAALEAEGKKQQTTLLAIVESTITEAELFGARARITVKFVSEQVHLVRDAEGEIVEGDPSQQEAVEDSWVFERTLTSGDPAWKVIET